jgi:hypothetical protein
MNTVRGVDNFPVNGVLVHEVLFCLAKTSFNEFKEIRITNGRELERVEVSVRFFAAWRLCVRKLITPRRQGAKRAFRRWMASWAAQTDVWALKTQGDRTALCGATLRDQFCLAKTPSRKDRIMAGMISRIFAMALALATILLAADPTGTWTGDQPGQNGNTYTITFKLKADGGKLTGTMGGDQFEQPIQNGEIHGDDISFAVHLDFGNGIDLKYTGKVGADQIDFKVMRGGESTAQPFVAKKAK